MAVGSGRQGAERRQEARMMDVLLKRFETPDEVREFPKGRFEIVRIGGMTIGRARYEPGWRWSEHNRPTVGTPTCRVEHVGVVISGRCAVKMDGGREFVLKAGDIFHVPPGHDSWVIGDEPYVSLHMLGAADYAR
jgi:quercetin dioxygenase-like cupin family protein